MPYDLKDQAHQVTVRHEQNSRNNQKWRTQASHVGGMVLLDVDF